MRFLYLNIILALVVLTSGCNSIKSIPRPSGQLISKVWNAPRQIAGKIGQLTCKKCKKAQPVVGAAPCGCDQCSQASAQFIAPAQEVFESHDFGPAVASQDCGCSQCSQAADAQYIAPAQEVFEGQGYTDVVPQDCGCNQGLQSPDSIPMYGYDEGIAPAVASDQDYNSFELPADTLTAPPVEGLNVEEGKFSPTPATPALTDPPAKADPYVEPGFDSAPPEIDLVPKLDKDTGFLSPQGLSGSENDVANDSFDVEPLDSVSDEDELDSVLGPTEAEAVGQRILRSKDNEEDRVVVLKARPVRNHRVNNQSVLRHNEAIVTNRTDSYGLPVDSQVQFAELPPIDNGTRPQPRPVSFERQEGQAKPMPPVKHLQEQAPGDPKDKTTMLENGNIHVVESTTNRPVDGEPMLRMTAVPYEGKSSLGAAIARIKVGKTPLIVRGAYPRDLEYERLARERNEQATRSVIIPNSSLKTIDR